jgi:hypothetical protein
MLPISSKPIQLNKSQAKVFRVNANVCHNLWPRAEGKSSIIGMRLTWLNERMPRSQVILYTDTYERHEQVIIPNITSFMTNEMGLIEDQDFVVGKKPPDHWVKPYIQPRKFDRVISFSDGLAVCQGSSFKDGSVNGFNAQAAIIDETKFVRQDRIKSQLYRALRGQFNKYGHLPEYRSVWTFSDKYQGDIGWILDLRDKQDMKLVNAVDTMQLRIIEWTELMNGAKLREDKNTYYKYRKMIIETDSRLNAVRKELVYVCDPAPFGNLEILGEKYYRDARRDCKTMYEYEIAVLNRDPNKAEFAFYPELTEENFYDRTDDVDPDKPLAIALDWQWRICPLVVGQMAPLGDNKYRTLNIVRAMHVLHPEGIVQVIKLFADAYKTHRKKVVFFLYDKTATGKDPARDEFYKIVQRELRKYGWSVIGKHMGQPPDHDIKHSKMKGILKHRGERGVMINKNTTVILTKCLYAAGTKIGAGGRTMKNKDDEKNLNIPAELTTDYTDAFDQLVWGAVELKLVGNTAGGMIDIRTG